MNKYPDEWDDLPADLRMQLSWDLVMFGAAYYEETDDGPKRVHPVEAAPDAEPKAVSSSSEVFGTSPVKALARRMAAMKELREREGRDA